MGDIYRSGGLNSELLVGSCHSHVGVGVDLQPEGVDSYKAGRSLGVRHGEVTDAVHVKVLDDPQVPLHSLLPSGYTRTSRVG